ncbi:HAMP domain-containing histidine kinase [Paucibacter sp. TC2R-5]|uniref:sensor histidine kinase n=1 Tax=Paucibacter sp. TC2R-5 TaxID=2893555 RepID=UPI0021E4588E|nr:HAMP domain-containing sensor histidine kinase [Paucibacter sp. TC2R-5]MCV2361314.1 HAMP domain-containing histidine kinase [Paucibacter sp. TC2R-5]
MTVSSLQLLANLVRENGEVLLLTWRTQVRNLPSASHLDTPTLNDHIPDLLKELAEALETNPRQTIPEALAEASPAAHGLQRLKDAFDIEEVVAEYNIMRGCIHDLATEHDITLQGRPFHVVNRIFDNAIGQAVQTYAAQQALEVKQRREEYLSFVAHDLRTPLFAISLTGRSLEKSLSGQVLGADSQRILQSLRRNVQQLQDLIGRVLEENTNLLEVIGVKVERRRFDLWPLVESLLDDIETIAAQSNTKLVNQVPVDLVVFADARLLRRAFQNLIGNAIQFSPGGEVIVGAQAAAGQESVECWVSDNGQGIAAEMIEKVFDKGESGGEAGSRSGLGLGLAIVKSFIEAHDGSITLHSVLGEGSKFYFTLPVQARPDA